MRMKLPRARDKCLVDKILLVDCCKKRYILTNELSVQCNGPVVVDMASLFEAEDISQINAVGGAMDVGDAIGVGKALVVFMIVLCFQEAIGVVDVRDVPFS